MCNYKIISFLLRSFYLLDWFRFAFLFPKTESLVKLFKRTDSLLIPVKVLWRCVLGVNESLNVNTTLLCDSQPKLGLLRHRLCGELSCFYSKFFTFFLLPLVKGITHTNSVIQALYLLIRWKFIFQYILTEVTVLFWLSRNADCLVDHFKGLWYLSFCFIVKSARIRWAPTLFWLHIEMLNGRFIILA